MPVHRNRPEASPNSASARNASILALIAFRIDSLTAVRAFRDCAYRLVVFGDLGIVA
jgi:hypothetical protein